MSFYFLSKTIGFLIQPSVVVLLALLAGFLLLLRKRPKWGRRMLALGLLGFLIGGLSPLGNVITVPLENRFARPLLAEVREQVAGIIVLGGVQDTMVATGRQVNALTDAAERLTDSLALAKALPGKPLVFTGGGSRIIYESMAEAESARRFYESVGVASERLWLERKSRNTYQNAVYTKKLLEKKGAAGRTWLLVTTAYHMPRAVGCFRKAGVKVIAWPVDYRTRGWQDATRLFSKPSEGLRRLDMVVREYIGLIAYYATGRIGALFPGPGQ